MDPSEPASVVASEWMGEAGTVAIVVTEEATEEATEVV